MPPYLICLERSDSTLLTGALMNITGHTQNESVFWSGVLFSKDQISWSCFWQICCVIEMPRIRVSAQRAIVLLRSTRQKMKQVSD